MFSRPHLATLLSIGLLPVTAGVASAQGCPPGTTQTTLTVQDTFGPATPSWDGPAFVMHVPKFDPALGTLLSAEVTLGTHLVGSVSAENTSNLSGCSLDWRLGTNFEIDTPIPTVPQLTAGPEVHGTDPLAVFDGINDGGGASGETHPNLMATDQASTTVTDPAVLASVFTGPGVIDFPHRALDASDHTGCGNLDIHFENVSDVFVRVRYTYCSLTPPTTCEERNRRQCSSLLLYPEFDNRAPNLTMITATYACCDDSAGSTWIEARFIDREFCLETNRSFLLTPCDTLSFFTRFINPNQAQGYVYIYAKRTNGPSRGGGSANPTGTPWVFNRLIGQELIFNPIEQLDYSMNAVGFKGLGEDQADNDDDGDGIRDLNGPHDELPEYEEAPDQIFIPRFLGQDEAAKDDSEIFKSSIVLVALSGGQAFRTVLNITAFNDNEEPLSAQYDFRCWDKPLLRDFAGGIVLESFLESLSSDDPDEILGVNSHNAGWMSIDGLVANSSGPESIDDPAFYAVLVERTGPFQAADLPWEFCSQTNGDLLPTSIFGDGPDFSPTDNE